MPRATAAGNAERVRLPLWIIQVYAHDCAQRALGTFPLHIALLGTLILVAMVGGDVDALPFAVIQHQEAFGGGKSWRQRIAHRPGQHTLRVPKPGAHQVHIMDAVIENLQTRSLSQKGPQVPWHVNMDHHFHVMDFAQESGFTGTFGRQHDRSKTQLKIDRCRQALPAAYSQDLLRLDQSVSHRLLDEHCGAVGQMRQHIQNCACRHSNIKDTALGRLPDCFRNRCHRHRDIKFLGHLCGALLTCIYQGRHRNSGFLIGGQMGIVNNTACPNHHHRKRVFRKGWSSVPEDLLHLGFKVGAHRDPMFTISINKNLHLSIKAKREPTLLVSIGSCRRIRPAPFGANPDAGHPAAAQTGWRHENRAAKPRPL